MATLAAVLAFAPAATAGNATPSGACLLPTSGVHVAPTGSDSNPGTAARPFRTIQHAVDATGAGATIIVHGGDYLESIVVRGSSRHIVGVPGEQVWVTGSNRVTSWYDSGGGTWTSTDVVAAGFDQRSDFDSSGMLADRPIAGHLAIAFIDGAQLEQVDSAAAVGAGSFYVSSGQVVIGRNPAGLYVDVGVRPVGLWLDNASGTTISGIGFRRHPTSLAEQGAVRVDEGSHDIVIEQSVFRDNANAGLQVLGDNVSVVHNQFSDNGRLGVNAHQADNLYLAHNRFDGNNHERFAQNAAAGGLKVTASRNLRIEQNLADNNVGTGYWVDVSSLGITIAGNRSVNNERYGYHVEASADATIVSNYSTGDERGIQIAESNKIRIYNNLLVDEEQGISILDGSRDSATGVGNGFGLPHDDRWPFPIPGITWNLGDIAVHNNVIVRGLLDEPMMFVQHTTSPQPALNLGVTTHHNLFHRTTTASPQLLIAWGNAGGTTDNYATIAPWRAAMAAAGSSNGTGDRETTGTTVTAVKDLAGGQLGVRDGGPGDGTGTPVPASVAAAVGTGGNNIGLLVNPGATAGPTCSAVGPAMPPPIDTKTALPPHPFVDIPPGTWFTTAVSWLYANGATTGTTPTTFSPHRSVTRAEVATIIWRLAGRPSAPDHPFRDVPTGTWYDEAIGWLYSTGATTGTTPTTFHPTRTATRAEVATIIWRLAGKPSGGSHQFSDVVTWAYYQAAVGWLAATGATTGTTPTTFSPSSTATRAQLATIIWRLADGGNWIA